ncbi:hypothetical protein GCM10018771_15080 [Streptomyces cellulosae]|nr:hypothetical protein GCM10018771_15080 [Streptomyces cellulosae]
MGASVYTKERLEEAAREARTLSEALVRLGVDPRSSTRRYVLTRMKRLGVDTSHFQREGAKWTPEILREAVAASTNMCEVLRRLGLEVVGGHHTHISRRIKAYGIDTSHFRTPTRRGIPRQRRTPETVLRHSARPPSSLGRRGEPLDGPLPGAGPPAGQAGYDPAQAAQRTSWSSTTAVAGPAPCCYAGRYSKSAYRTSAPNAVRGPSGSASR